MRFPAHHVSYIQVLRCRPLLVNLLCLSVAFLIGCSSGNNSEDKLSRPNQNTATAHHQSAHRVQAHSPSPSNNAFWSNLLKSISGGPTSAKPVVPIKAKNGEAPGKNASHLNTDWIDQITSGEGASAKPVVPIKAKNGEASGKNVSRSCSVQYEIKTVIGTAPDGTPLDQTVSVPMMVCHYGKTIVKTQI